MHNSIVTQPGIRKIPGFFYPILAICLLLASLQAQAAVADAWAVFRDSLFAGKAVEENAGFISLSAPHSAENPALVPVSFRIARPDIKQAWLLVDGNPVPLTATFHFLQLQPEPTAELRIRLEKSTWVRLVAETTAGTLHMAAIAIKTPGGGCGGGMDGDEAKLRAEAGQMKLQRDMATVADNPSFFTYLLKHPMRTGFERTTQGYYARAWFINRLDFSQGGVVFLSMDLGVGISADPRLRLSYLPLPTATIGVKASDNEGRLFEQQFPTR
jgi:sulfur-oxidizing protein SoxY